MSYHLRPLAAFMMLAAVAQPAAAELPVTWLSQSQTHSAQYPVEVAAFEALKGDGFAVQRSEFQTLGLNMADGLRTASQGTFNIVSATIGSVARDDAFLEGLDLIGVSTNLDELKTSVDAYRESFNTRLEERFGVKALAIWPFGAQIFFCNQPVKSLDDLKGLKIRSFTASMSTLLSELGANPVTLSFPEVYPALERGVASCGVTSATSANTGKWPEVTSHVLPLSVSGSVQAHLVNIDWWKSLSADQQKAMEGHFRAMEDKLWALAVSTNTEALDCTVGKACESKIYKSYKSTLADVSDADRARVKAISSQKVLTEWAGRCTKVYADCASVWNKTIGAAMGVSIAN